MPEADLESIEHGQEIVKSVGIPPQPEIVLQVNDEINQDEPDFKKIADLVNKDVSLAAKAIKIVNSPYFGLLKPVQSIGQAISLLGLKNFYKIIVASSLQEALSSDKLNENLMSRFWDHSFLVASISELVAKKAHSDSPTPGEFTELLENAYPLGLFHDCAIPLMLKKFPDYKDMAQDALNGTWSAEAPTTIGEEAQYSTSHSAIGYIVAKSWQLNEHVCEAIRHHHDPEITKHEDLTRRKLIANLLLAECIVEIFTIGNSADIEDSLASLPEEFLFELDLGVDDIPNIRERIARILEEL